MLSRKKKYQKTNACFLSFYNSDIKIHLAGNGDVKQDKISNEVCAHKFVLATRNESWGRSDLDMLGKNSN